MLFFFFKRKHSPHRVHSDLLTRQFWNSFIFMLRITWLYKNAEQTKQGGLKEKEPTHRELCTVWTDRWPTLTCSTPARQGTGQKDTPQFSYLPHTMQGSNDHNRTEYDSESPKWCRGLVVKKKQQKTPLTRVKVREKKTWDRRQESIRANSSMLSLCVLLSNGQNMKMNVAGEIVPVWRPLGRDAELLLQG